MGDKEQRSRSDARGHADDAFAWWRAMQPDSKRANPVLRAGNRAALARLRRCGSVALAGVEEEAIKLALKVGVQHGGDRRLGDALLTAIVLAHVRENDSEPVARRLGPQKQGERAAFSPIRLARLLSAESFDERLIAFRRVATQLGGKANVRDLAAALLDWSERTRIDWAFRYHNAPPPGAHESADTAAVGTGSSIEPDTQAGDIR